MRRNRFDEILRFLHIANSKWMHPNDRMEKLRPMMDHLQDAFQKAYIPEKIYPLTNQCLLIMGGMGANNLLEANR